MCTVYRCDAIEGCELVLESENAKQLLVLIEKTISDGQQLQSNGMRYMQCLNNNYTRAGLLS